MLSRGWESSELSRLLFVWLLQAATYGNDTRFCTAPRSSDSQEWGRWGRRGWQGLRLGQLGSFTHSSNRNRVLWQPRRALSLRGHRATRRPRRMLGGGSRSQNHQRLCPDFAPSAIAGAELPLPSTVLPLGRISAHPSAVIPAGCAEKGERSRPCSLFELRLGEAPGYLSTRAAGDAHLFTHAGKPRSSCFRRDSAARQELGSHPRIPLRTGTRLSAAPPTPFQPLYPLQTSNFHSLPCHTHHSQPPQFALKRRAAEGLENLGGGGGEAMVAGASLSLTSFHAQHRGQHGEQESLHGADDVAGEMRRAAGGAQGWRQGREPGVGKGRRLRPAGRARPPRRLPPPPPRPRLVSFPRSGEPGPGKWRWEERVGMAAAGRWGTEPAFPQPCPKRLFPAPFRVVSVFLNKETGVGGAACVPDPTHPSAVLPIQFMLEFCVSPTPSTHRTC